MGKKISALLPMPFLQAALWGASYASLLAILYAARIFFETAYVASHLYYLAFLSYVITFNRLFIPFLVSGFCLGILLFGVVRFFSGRKASLAKGETREKVNRFERWTHGLQTEECRKRSLILLSAVFLFELFLQGGVFVLRQIRTPQGPNLILISIDTLRADHLGSYGYPRETSPFIDRWAASSTLFLNAISQSPHTTPSHATLFTSLYPSQHGLVNLDKMKDPHLIHRLSKDHLTLAEVLKNEGYRTAAFTGGGNVAGFLGFSRGFDLYRDQSALGKKPFKGFSEWLSQHPGEPFFVFLHTYEVHWPYLPPEPFNALYAGEYTGTLFRSRKEASALLKEKGGSQDGVLDHDLLWKLFWDRVDPQQREDIDHIKNLYDGAIRYVDYHVYQLFSLLKEHQLLEKTFIVLTSDHGEEFFEHGGKVHDTLYDEILKVPLILSWPGRIPQGMRIASQVNLMDLSPTILDLLKIRIPASFEGESFAHFFEGASSSRVAISERTPLQEGHHKTSIRTDDWKLVQTHQGEAELYHLKEDPFEKNNVREDAFQKREALSKRLEAWEESLSVKRSEAQSLQRSPEVEAQLEHMKALGYLH